MAKPQALLLPLQLDAFVLNKSSCDANNHYYIAPITQPNYTFMRLTDNLIVPDILDHVDLHDAGGIEFNSRLTDIGSGRLRQSRLGVYLSWTLPQVYRQAAAAAPDVGGGPSMDHADRKLAQGYPAPSGNKISPDQLDYSVPDFRPVPNRWLVTRRLESYQPSNVKIPVFQSWIVESDRITNINDPDCPLDLEAERTPFINPSDLNPVDDHILDSQAEIFIGRKTSYDNFIKPDVQNARNQAHRIETLTVASSGNLLFPDYQPHNSNVFSIVDNFEYRDSNGATQYLSHAKADYFVVGWHTRSDHDPFTSDPSLRNNPVLKNNASIQERLVHARRMKDCNMTLKDTNDLAKAWLNDNSDFRVLCHASKYDVVYDAAGFGSTHVVAEDVGTTLKKQQSVSVGTTAIEALIAYCRAHAPADAGSAPTSGGLDLGQIEEYLIRLSTLLQTANSEDVDALQAAVDEQFVQAFKHVDGGPTWHFQQTDVEQTDVTTGAKKVTLPSADDLKNLQSLNEVQALLSAISRRMTENSWKLFTEWWLFVSNFGNKADPKDRVRALLSERASLAQQGNNFATSFTSTKASLTNEKASKQPQKGTSDRFYQRKEPTILLGNTKSGWDDDFSDLLQTRLDYQVVRGSDPNSQDSQWPNYLLYLTNNANIGGDDRPSDGVLGKVIPPELANPALKLYREFYLLRSAASQSATVPSPQVLPYFYNATSPTQGRDRWQNMQPFKPLFLEWEAMYFHIPFDKFSFGSFPHQTGSMVCQYGFDSNEDISKLNIQDIRTSSGRTILLPQSQTSLKTTLQNVFKNTNPDLLKSSAYGLDPDHQKQLLGSANAIEFISTPLTGLTEDLLTIHQGGAHVKPTVRLPNQKPIVIDAARKAFKTLDTAASDGLFNNLGSETKEVPYGGSVVLSASGPCPMKPITHGQLLLTKLNIIDRFGQAVAIVDPKPHFRTGVPGKVVVNPIAPCLSDSYFPGLTSDGRPNTVMNNGMACTMLQLTPSINQPARINASFVMRDPDSRKWRIASGWDNPIWGWIVINYAEYGLQFYTKEGYFYREVRQGGPTGQTAGLKWLPFNPPTNVAKPTQLDILINRLTSTPGYLQSFFDLLNQSISEQQVGAPTAYSQYTSSIIGKPVALTSFGWSLELADPPCANYSTSNTKTPDSIFGYKFPMKIGDKDRVYDGLIGLYGCNRNAGAGQADYKLDDLWTYFLSDKTGNGDPRKLLTPSSISSLQPYYNDPLQPQEAIDKMDIYGAILDPYVPVHFYTSILPNVSLKLPDWTTQDALQNITAFLHAGPLITPIDVPSDFQSNREVQSAAAANPMDIENLAPKMMLPLKAPSGAMNGAGAKWRWLQPYVVGTNTEFNAFGMSDDTANGVDATQAKLLPGPYTAVEGFLQVIKVPPPPDTTPQK